MSRKAPGHRRDCEPSGRPQPPQLSHWKLVRPHRVLAIMSLLLVVFAATASFAQERWTFANEIPCSSAPVYGVPFTRCWTSNVRTFRIGSVQGWRLTFADAMSESEVGLYSLVDPRGSGGLPPVSAGSSMIEWIRTADALKDVTAGAAGWTPNGNDGQQPYVTFQKGRRQCLAFVRNGPAQRWILGAAFCRESASPIAASEAAFISDAIKVRQ